jgi:hypothetical protein
VVADPRAQEVVAALKLDDGSALAVRMPAGIVSGLTLALRSEFAKVAVQPGTRASVGQPLSLMSSQPFVLADKRIGLMLQIENFQVPVDFPKEAIAVLKETIARLEEMTRNPPKQRLD